MNYQSTMETDATDWEDAVNVVWLFVPLVLVVIMQAGFASYEVGSINSIQDCLLTSPAR